MMDITSSVGFQVNVLLFVALIGYIIASRINQSAVVGVILGGILIGPSVFGIITYTDLVSSLAHLGAIVLLFTVGLHFKLQELTKWKYFVIALVGIIVPWIGGYLIARLFNFDFSGAIIIGTALTATSIAITANVLKEMGKLDTEAARAIIGAAVIDDILGLLALSMSIGIVEGALNSFDIVLTILKVAVFLAGGVVLGKFVAHRIMKRIDDAKIADKFPEFAFMFAMMIAFLYSVASELVGLSAILGSFLAGVSLGGVDLKHGKSFKEGAEFINMIFGAIFFVSLGILINLREIDARLLLFLTALTLVAIITKVIGCGLSARLLGMNKCDSLIIGFGMSPRGEVAMIVALIGLTDQLIQPNVYTAIVIMALITTIITPVILRTWFFTKKEVSFKFA